MQLIFGKENADALRERYTILDLETIDVEGKTLEVFCLVPGEKIGLTELPFLAKYVKLHHDFVNGYKTKQYEYCKHCAEYLKGKFGGEVDSFYEEILRRINEEENIKI